MNKKKLLALLMALVMTLTLVPVTALATETTVATVETETELTDALTSGGTVKLGADIVLTKQLVISQTVTIDLNGHNITSTMSYDGNNGILKITGNVIITDSAVEKGCIMMGKNNYPGVGLSGAGSSLTVDSAVIKGESGSSSADGGCAICINDMFNRVTLNINNSEIYGGDGKHGGVAIKINSSSYSGTGHSVTITNSTVVGGNSLASTPGNGQGGAAFSVNGTRNDQLTISGSTIKAGSTPDGTNSGSNGACAIDLGASATKNFHVSIEDSTVSGNGVYGVAIARGTNATISLKDVVLATWRGNNSGNSGILGSDRTSATITLKGTISVDEAAYAGFDESRISRNLGKFTPSTDSDFTLVGCYINDAGEYTDKIDNVLYYRKTTTGNIYSGKLIGGLYRYEPGSGSVSPDCTVIQKTTDKNITVWHVIPAYYVYYSNNSSHYSYMTPQDAYGLKDFSSPTNGFTYYASYINNAAATVDREIELKSATVDAQYGNAIIELNGNNQEFRFDGTNSGSFPYHSMFAGVQGHSSTLPVKEDTYAGGTLVFRNFNFVNTGSSSDGVSVLAVGGANASVMDITFENCTFTNIASVLNTDAFAASDVISPKLTVKGCTFTNYPEKDQYISTEATALNQDVKHSGNDANTWVEDVTYVAQVNGTDYPTLAGAIAAANAGDTVNLLQNIALTETVNIEKDLTINLADYDITATNARALHVKSGNVTITGEGTISANGDNLSDSSSVIRVGDGSKDSSPLAKASLTIGPDVTVESNKCYGITAFGINDSDDDKTTSDIELVVNGKVNVTGSQAAISGNGNSWNTPTTMTIKGSVSATQDYAIYHPGKGTLIVNGTVTGKGGIEMKGGSANINSGARVTANASVQTHSDYNNGASTSGYAIAAVSNPNYVGDPAVTIDAGATITGKAVILADFNAKNVGTVTAERSDIPTDPDYKWVETETAGVYKLVEKDYVAQIDDVKYETLQAAIDAVPTDGTATIVTVLAKETDLGGATIDGNRNVVLDLNEKTVYAYANLKKGKLTVQNGCLCGYTQSIKVFGSADSTKAAGEYNELTIASNASIGNGGDYYGIVLWNVQKDNAGESKYAYGSKINVDGEILDNIWVMGNIKEGNSVINIKDGAHVTATDTAIALQGKATVNVKGGAITGRTGIENRGGTLNVTGGTITGNGEMIQVQPNGNGVTTLGAGVVVSQHTTRQDITVNVTGGTITGEVALLAVNPEGNPTGEGTLTVNVTGGTFTGGSSAVAVLNADERVQVSLKGGTYSSNPSAAGNEFTYYLYGKDDTVTANVKGSGVDTTVQTTNCVATGYKASQSGNVWIIEVNEYNFEVVKDANDDAVSNKAEEDSNTSFSFATATSGTDDDVTYAIKTTTITGEVQTDSYKPVETEVVTKSSVDDNVAADKNGVTNNVSTTAIENSIKETATSMTSTITAKKGSETATTDILKTIAAANAITKAAAAYEAGDGHKTSDIAKVEVQLETTLTGYTLANSGDSDVTASKVVFSVVPKAVLLDVEGNQLGNAVPLANSDLAEQQLKITFTLPIPDKLVDTGTMKVRVTHKSNGDTVDVNDYTVQGNAGSYFVEITAEKFSDFEVEKISATEVNLNAVNYVSSYSLTCTDKIGVNFYFHLTDEVLYDSNSYIKVSFNGQYESGATLWVHDVIADKDGEYKFSYYVAPAESTKPITLTLYTSSGKVDIYDRNGSKTDDGTFTKSMKDVAEIYLSSTTASAKMKTLASRLIAYCVYTELYFERATDHDYSNVVLGNIEDARAGLAEYALVNLAGVSIGYDGMSLLLDKETSIKLYTLNPNQTLAYSFNGGASTELNPYASGGEYAVKISNLPGAYLDRMYSITVGTDVVLRVSALSWANSMINKNDPYKQNIAAAMYYYNVAANEYFGQKGV